MPGLPPHSAHPRPGARTSAGAASREREVRDEEVRGKASSNMGRVRVYVQLIILTLTRYREMFVILCPLCYLLYREKMFR